MPFLPKHFQNASPQTLIRILNEEFLPAAIPFMLQPEDHFHGLEHCRETALLATFISIKEGSSPWAPMMAACLHDAGRKNNDESQQHAYEGANIAKVFFRCSPIGSLFSSEDQAEITEAIYHHAEPAKAKNGVGAYLQDADRLRLAWIYGVRPELFSTESGLQFAQVGRRLTMRTLASFFEKDS